MAELLATEGANVALCARNQENVDEAVASLAAKGVKATGTVVDVTDDGAYRARFTTVLNNLWDTMCRQMAFNIRRGTKLIPA